MYGITKESYHLVLAIALIVVNLFSGILVFSTESKSANIIDSFNKMIPHTCTIISEGKKCQVDTNSLVTGDIVLLKHGTKCPADIRLTEQNCLKIDLSSFNGESEPASRKIENVEMNILRAQNIVYFTSNIVQGEGRGVVIFTGDKTVIGQQAKSVVTTKQP